MAHLVHTTDTAKLKDAVRACQQAGVQLPCFVRNRGWDEALKKTSRRALDRKKAAPPALAIQHKQPIVRITRTKRAMRIAKRERDFCLEAEKQTFAQNATVFETLNIDPRAERKG